MDELELYKKMYATVVYQVDDVLQELSVTLADQDCGWKELNDFGERLKQALLDAEEIYISAEDEEEGFD